MVLPPSPHPILTTGFPASRSRSASARSASRLSSSVRPLARPLRVGGDRRGEVAELARRRAVPPLRGAPRTTGSLSAARVLAAAHRAHRLDPARRTRRSPSRPSASCPRRIRQAGVAQAVKSGNTTRPRFVDHRRPDHRQPRLDNRRPGDDDCRSGPPSGSGSPRGSAFGGDQG
jgi:hypothetical protein